jgi:hypothetical protein
MANTRARFQFAPPFPREKCEHEYRDEHETQTKNRRENEREETHRSDATPSEAAYKVCTGRIDSSRAGKQMRLRIPSASRKAAPVRIEAAHEIMGVFDYSVMLGNLSPGPGKALE